MPVAAEVASSSFEALEYRNVGPFRGGRSTAVTGVAGAPFVFYLGTTGGGVWKSENAGTTWHNVSDGFFDSASIGAIAVAPSDANVVYVGTGSGCPRGNVMNGDGVYRSTDAGKTWSHAGLASAGLIPRLAVDPRDPDLVFAAVLGDIFEPSAERGIYRSRDGGRTWQQVHHVSERTGAVDLVMNPRNPRELYAALWTAERKPWTIIDGGSEGGVVKSVDGGDTWTAVTAGLPTGELGRIGLALSPAKRERVWAQIATADDSGGLFRSDDGGESWERVNAERKIQVRAWYYNHLTADPQDADTLYAIGLRFWRSIDGGKTFDSVRTPHGDNHDLWINPRDSKIMIEANDGGGTVTLDGGETWSTLHNQPTAELYRLTVDERFPYRLYAPQQDNTSISVPAWSAGGISAEQEWWLVGGGESGDVAVHPDKPDVIYSGNYIGLIERWDRATDDRRGVMVYPELADGVPPRDLTYRFQWNAPIRLSPRDPDTLYQASHRVHRSRDGGQTWETLSEDLTYDDESKQELPGGPIQHDDTGVEVYGTVFAFEESAQEPGVLWAGSDDGRLHLSRDDGATWTEVTPPGLPVDTTINMLELSPHAPGRVFLAAHRYRLGDDRPYVLRTDDYGATWTSLGTGLPQDQPVRVVREDPERRGLLFAGNHAGVWMSFDDGKTWQSLRLNLPHVQVADMRVHHGDLVLATHGRSFWVLDQIAPLRQMNPEVSNSQAYLFAPPPAYQVAAGGRFGAGAEPDARGTGALIDFWIGEGVLPGTEEANKDQQGEKKEGSAREEKEPLGTLGLYDADGELVREYELIGDGEPEDDEIEVEAGLNRLRWDLRSAEPETLEDAVMSLGYTGGTGMPPGSYEVRLAIGDEVQSQTLVLAPDPRLGVAIEDYRAGYELTVAVRERMVAIHAVVEHLRSVRAQVEELQTRLEEAGSELSIDEPADALFAKLTALEDELIQRRAEAPQDPLNFPPRLDNQYAFLYGELSGLRGRPNDGAYKRLADLDGQWDGLRGEWEAIVAGELAAINDLLQSAATPAILVPE
jgi:photosystem II stability/assembly factor-like uncharacterized protein